MTRKSVMVAMALVVMMAAAFPAYAADTQNLSSKINLDGADVSKHYDPAHVGHEHQCASCKRTYHQPGDTGQYSQGTYRCPYCGYQNNVPPSPVNPYPPQPPVPPAPPTPPYPPTPYPPQPPVPPTPYPPQYDNVDQLLRLWDQASDYRTADNIIVAGSNNVASLKGLCRLALKAYYDANYRAIVNNFNRPNIVVDVTPDDIIYFWDKADKYDKADMIAVAAAQRLNSVKGILRVSFKLYYKNSWQALLGFVDNNFGRIYDPPTVNDLCFYWDKASNYELADRILLTGARYMRTIVELGQLANKAYYQSTRNAIEALYAQVGGGQYYPPQPQYSVNVNPAVEAPLVDEGAQTKSAKKSSTSARLNVAQLKLAANALNSQNTAIDLTVDDMKNLNAEKIGAFIEKYNAGAFKKSDFLMATKDGLVKRLKEASLSNQKAAEMLRNIK